MKIEELQHLECVLCDIISDSFDQMPNAGSVAWDLQKVDLINKVMGELSNVAVELS